MQNEHKLCVNENETKISNLIILNLIYTVAQYHMNTGSLIHVLYDVCIKRDNFVSSFSFIHIRSCKQYFEIAFKFFVVVCT